MRSTSVIDWSSQFPEKAAVKVANLHVEQTDIRYDLHIKHKGMQGEVVTNTKNWFREDWGLY